MSSYHYYSNCVGWPKKYVGCDGGLMDMCSDAIDIYRETFLKHVDRQELRELEEALGYAAHPSRGLTMAGDWSVSYHRSKFMGERVYFFCHSAIEYVFIPEDFNWRRL